MTILSVRAPDRTSWPDVPLYDPRLEHDACGIGFVADAGGRSRDRVLPLALAGLGALGHRGAFAADGETSDGAGVGLPLDPALVAMIAPGAGDRPGIVALFLPRASRARSRSRRIVDEALVGEGLGQPAWRDVPVRPEALGAEAAATLPFVAHAIVRRPPRASSARFELGLVLAARRIESAARASGLEISVVSSSARRIVYKGLVTGGRLATLYPDLGLAVPLRYALFHQRYATNTHPTWRLAQPFRTIAHNGEINTVRGNREHVRGRRADRRPRGPAGRLLDMGPLLSQDGSDSLSLDEAVELLEATGWRADEALLGLIPAAPALRAVADPELDAFSRRAGTILPPWDGPAAIVFGDGRRVGALVDRNGLRPAAYAVTRDRLVVLASEAGAVPLQPGETVTRRRLGPGEMLLVDPDRGEIHEPEGAPPVRSRALSVVTAADNDQAHAAASAIDVTQPTSTAVRYLAGLDAERLRLDVRTMALESHEPLWSMGDDTPLAALGRIDRPATDHLRQSFAQVTNPAIDPERERAVVDLGVDVGPRPPLLGGLPVGPSRSVRLPGPVILDLAPLERAAAALGHPVGMVELDTTWDGRREDGLERALSRLAERAVGIARRGGRSGIIVLSDRAISLVRPPIPSVLAIGAVHTALTDAGLRGRIDIVAEASDVLEVHGLAMALAAGATAVRPWLAIELAVELAGGRGAEDLGPGDTARRLVEAFEAGLRKTLARIGVSALASYLGGALFETLELAPEVVARCFPAAPGWSGSVGFAQIGGRVMRRLGAARLLEAKGTAARLPDIGLARFRGDGERHLYAPAVVKVLQGVVSDEAQPGSSGSISVALGRRAPVRPDPDPALVRDELELRRPKGRRLVPLAEVEPIESIVRRFVGSAMSIGALSPEAHRAVTLGIQRAGGAANTGEGGEDPAHYRPSADGERQDSKIKQVASGRFGVTAAYLARADQLEIKIAQGSKPGEGGQLPGIKATAYIAAIRRAQPGQSLISPPPHHDIYSIEDLAQLVADLRAAAPGARIGVKLVASRGVGTIAAGVAKAGADYVHIAGHAGGTGASPLSSIKHVGAPWELGLAETHQVLLRNGLRDRVIVRTDGGLRTGRDVVVAALLGAEEFGFGTALLVALGCDMARQCHLDTCPTGIATQREDLRAKFTGTPEQVERLVRTIAEDVRLTLAAVGARSVGEIIGEAAGFLRPVDGATLDLGAVVGAPRWKAGATRRAQPDLARDVVSREPASGLEHRIVAEVAEFGPGSAGVFTISNADRSFGAELSGAIERGEIGAPVRLGLSGSAGQSFGAFLAAGMELRLTGQANDYVGKGLSGGTVVVRPEAGLPDPDRQAIAGNVCLYGATAGRLHLVGRAGMRFAVRNSGAEAVVEGLGAHGCEYMTGGIVVVLGPVGPNFGAGMTGGRAYIHAPDGVPAGLLNGAVGAVQVSTVVRERMDATHLVADLIRLLEAHRHAGSDRAAALFGDRAVPLADFWLVEPVGAAAAVPAAAESEQSTGEADSEPAIAR
jgi:glutamate synthase domain-containing protein 2/glutamate synthase domain-containing protein 1/glutamate synthase domain-containing protein 3